MSYGIDPDGDRTCEILVAAVGSRCRTHFEFVLRISADVILASFQCQSVGVECPVDDGLIDNICGHDTDGNSYPKSIARTLLCSRPIGDRFCILIGKRTDTGGTSHSYSSTCRDGGSRLGLGNIDR